MVEIGYDAKKMPLGKVSKNTIKQGYEVLQKLSKELGKPSPNSATIAQLSSDFYTVIPHDFGFQKMSNFILRDKKSLKEKILMVESLADIEIASKLLSNDMPDVNPADEHYKKLKCDMKPLKKSDATYKMLCDYVKNSHAKTHGR